MTLCEEITIDGLKAIPMDFYSDERGDISSIFHFERTHKDLGTWLSWEEEKIIRAKENSLRGLHGHINTPTAKLITCLHGCVFVAIVDGRINSPTFGEVNSFNLNPTSKKSRNQIYVPHGCLNGHFAYIDSVFHYKWDRAYAGLWDQFTVKWDDRDLSINWPTSYYAPIISERDKQGISWLEYKEKLRETH